MNAVMTTRSLAQPLPAVLQRGAQITDLAAQVVGLLAPQRDAARLLELARVRLERDSLAEYARLAFYGAAPAERPGH